MSTTELKVDCADVATGRKLATVRKIISIDPIPDADSISKARVDGWQVVVKNGQFQPGDLAIYIEIDSFLPIREEFEFLRPSSYRKLGDGTEGFRLRTIKLRKVVSQGLLLPISILDEFNLNVREGDDVTGLLKITKYDPPVPAELSGSVVGGIIHLINRTNQERIQNIPEFLDIYRDSLFEVTEKINGTSMTVYCNDGHFGVCSHNYEFRPDTQNSFTRVATALDLEKKMKSLGRNIAIQGELVGEGIQKNPYRLKGQHFYVFDIWDIDLQRYMTASDRVIFLDRLHVHYKLLLHHVPILEKVLLGKLGTVEDLLVLSNGKSLMNPSICPEQIREGLVFKSCDYIDGKIVSFKVVSNSFLLSEK